MPRLSSWGIIYKLKNRILKRIRGKLVFCHHNNIIVVFEKIK